MEVEEGSRLWMPISWGEATIGGVGWPFEGTVEWATTGDVGFRSRTPNGTTGEGVTTEVLLPRIELDLALASLTHG